MKQDWHNKEFECLVTLGESTTAGGWSSSRERCWASRLSVLISDVQSQPVRLINSGIGANVISTRSPSYEHSGKPAGQERLEKHVFEHRPDLLIVSYGLNDARGGTPLAQFAEDLSILVGRVRDNCAPLIVLPGPYFMTDFSVGGQVWSHADLRLFEKFNRQIASVADTLDCLFVDLLAGYDRTPWLVHHDGVHANDLGHLVVAHRIFEKLLQNCSGLARNTQALEE
ncbi:MAG: SGNH/GDSL hydrolase family protein, partial [Candidatus Latescibacterota bacterium]|nr:SGNH/GDSL hydrolase family protein [Candidatus Latescibacterota bacterium]